MAALFPSFPCRSSHAAIRAFRCGGGIAAGRLAEQMSVSAAGGGISALWGLVFCGKAGRAAFTHTDLSGRRQEHILSAALPFAYHPGHRYGDMAR